MIADNEEIRTIRVSAASDSQYAAIDAKIREMEARTKYADFFNSPDHIKRVSEVKHILESFFGGKYRKMYETARPNRGKPYTSIKVEAPVFPNTKSRDLRQSEYHDPLKKLGVEITFSENTNSYLYRVV